MDMNNLLYTSQAKRMFNIASTQDIGLTSVNTGSGGMPNSSGLTTTTTSGVATLTNTTFYYNDTTQTGTVTRDVSANLNQYINVYSRSGNAPTSCTFNFNIAGSGTIPTGSFVSIHIDSNVLTTDVFVIQAGSYTTSVPNAVAPGNITCTPGTTYTFICFQGGIWTRM